MKREVYVVNNSGYIENVFVKRFNEQGECEEEITNNIITVSPPNGLYRAKWIGTEWIEDMSKEEIDALNNQPKPITQEQRISDLELLVLQLGGVI